MQLAAVSSNIRYSSIQDSAPEAFKNEWRKLPRTPYKIFLEAFVDPKNFRLPHDTTGHITNGSLSEIPNLIELINPKLLTESFLKEMRIIGQEDKKPDLSQDVINKIIGIFECLEPMPKTNKRIWIIKNSIISQELESRNSGLIGSLIYIREKPNTDNKIAMHFESLSTVERKPVYQSGNAKNEVYGIARLVNRIKTLKASLEHWKNFLPEERTFITKESHDISEKTNTLMKAPINKNKRTAKNLVTRADGIQDRIGRVNPPAIWNVLDAAERSLTKRLNELTPKASANHIDELGIIDFKSNQSTVFDLPENNLRAALTILKSLHIFGKKKLSESQIRSSISGFLVKFNLSEEHLSQVVSRPYLTFKNILLKKQKELIISAVNRDLTTCSKTLEEMLLVVKLVRFQEKVDKANYSLTLGAKGLPVYINDLEDLIEPWKELHENFLAQHPQIERYFSDYSQALNNSISEAQRLSSLSPLKAKELAKFKESILAFSIENRVKSIPMFN